MNLLALLFALACERGLTQLLHLRELRWLDRYCDAAGARLARSSSLLRLFATTLVVLVPVLPIAAVSVSPARMQVRAVRADELMQVLSVELSPPRRRRRFRGGRACRGREQDEGENRKDASCRSRGAHGAGCIPNGRARAVREAGT